MKRLFTAIGFTPTEKWHSLLNELHSICPPNEVKWVKATNLHLTLHFFGQCHKGQQTFISDAMKETARNIPPFTIEAKGLGYFGSDNKPKVIWCGIDKSDELIELSRSFESALGKSFPPPKTAFNPHITLGRTKGKLSFTKLLNYISKNKERYMQTIEVRSITLFESRLSSAGPEYFIEENIPLKS